VETRRFWVRGASLPKGRGAKASAFAAVLAPVVQPRPSRRAMQNPFEKMSMQGLAAQNQLAAAGAGVNYGQVGGGCVRSGPARRPGEEAFVFRLRSLPQRPRNGA
jgi:hypothetical protein